MSAVEEYRRSSLENMHALIVGSAAIEMVPKVQADAAVAELLAELEALKANAKFWTSECERIVALACDSAGVSDIDALAGKLEQAEAEVERLKCCGNCKRPTEFQSCEEEPGSYSESVNPYDRCHWNPSRWEAKP